MEMVSPGPREQTVEIQIFTKSLKARRKTISSLSASSPTSSSYIKSPCPQASTAHSPASPALLDCYASPVQRLQTTPLRFPNCCSRATGSDLMSANLPRLGRGCWAWKGWSKGRGTADDLVGAAADRMLRDWGCSSCWRRCSGVAA